MSIITRTIQEKIEKSLFKGKIVVIYGARQVGKTTLVKEIQKKYNTNSVYYNCEERDIAEVLTNKTSTELKAFIGSKKLIILDEAFASLDIKSKTGLYRDLESICRKTRTALLLISHDLEEIERLADRKIFLDYII